MTQVNVISITSAVCMCGKVCKNLRGLKIHHLSRGQVKQHTGAVASMQSVVVLTTEPGQTEEEPGLVLPHSARNLQATRVHMQDRKSEQCRVR